MTEKPKSISEAIENYLQIVQDSRSALTLRSYRIGLNSFKAALLDNGLDPDSTPAKELPDKAVSWLIKYLRDKTAATSRLYLQAAINLYEYLFVEEISAPNLVKIHNIIKNQAKRPGQRLPQFPVAAIEDLISKCEVLKSKPSKTKAEHLRNLRDRAFLLTLADTGLRVHEACALRRGNLEMHENRARVISKGNKETIVRFSFRAIDALDDYLMARSTQDGSSGRPLTSLPVFTRHDKGAGRKLKAITTSTGRHIVRDRVREFLGEDSKGKITPHSFRHYFVTRILQSTGNLKLAQELARHQNIGVTERYTHLSNGALDKGYYESIIRDNKGKRATSG